jgi:hypothetical protein
MALDVASEHNSRLLYILVVLRRSGSIVDIDLLS